MFSPTTWADSMINKHSSTPDWNKVFGHLLIMTKSSCTTVGVPDGARTRPTPFLIVQSFPSFSPGGVFDSLRASDAQYLRFPHSEHDSPLTESDGRISLPCWPQMQCHSLLMKINQYVVEGGKDQQTPQRLTKKKLHFGNFSRWISFW